MSKAKVGTRVLFLCCDEWKIGEVVEVIQHKDQPAMWQRCFGTTGISYRCETAEWSKQAGRGSSAICKAKDIKVWQ